MVSKLFSADRLGMGRVDSEDGVGVLLDKAPGEKEAGATNVAELTMPRLLGI